MQKYLQLFLASANVKSKGYGKSQVIAFTSARAEEGVSYVTEAFGGEVARMTKKRTLIADVRRLMQTDISHYNRVNKHCLPTSIPELWVLPAADFDAAATAPDSALPVAPGNLELGVNNLTTLRFAFDYVLLDCPAISASAEASLLASETDGVIMVVQADRTRREQIETARQTIETANGKLLGFVLNKRSYPVPGWLYRKL